MKADNRVKLRNEIKVIGKVDLSKIEKYRIYQNGKAHSNICKNLAEAERRLKQFQWGHKNSTFTIKKIN